MVELFFHCVHSGIFMEIHIFESNLKNIRHLTSTGKETSLQVCNIRTFETSIR